ncbi:MAG: NAD(P)/FAD-dependent oxidoreductase [Oscillospiraceae bacterium]|nr:NAD(P)/FAD-dependent oxidoreductase [Oscillospiraceae bacterium]
MADTIKTDVAIIGGGPAGLAAATAAASVLASAVAAPVGTGAGATLAPSSPTACARSKYTRVLLIERDARLGGILNQCIHNGFGLENLKQDLTGPEYADIQIKIAESSGVDFVMGAMAVDVDIECEGVLRITISGGFGRCVVEAKSLVLATGCRERALGSMGVPGTRPAGIYTAGVVQHLMNVRNVRVGKRAVILGSGDIGLIMARRMSLEGMEVAAVVEKMPYPGGLARNVSQCLDDFGIPLLLSHTVTEIIGMKRIEAVRLSRVDASNDSFIVPCDTLVLSVGLIPENELAKLIGVRLDPRTGGAVVDENMHTVIDGVFACGNALHVHDIVDHVTDEGARAGANAAMYAIGALGRAERYYKVTCSGGVRYALPQMVSGDKDCNIMFRCSEPVDCCRVALSAAGQTLATRQYVRLLPSIMNSIPVKAGFHGDLEVSLHPK